MALLFILALSALAQTSTPLPAPTISPTASATDTVSPTPSAAATEALPPPTPTQSEALPTGVAATPSLTATLEITSTATPSATLVLAAGGAPQSASGGVGQGKQMELTVYNQNFALVKEVRALDLEKGDSVVRYADVAEQIQPESVHLISLTDPQGTTVLEQNYEYDLVSSKLLAKYVDQQIALSTQDGRVYTGTLLSGAGDVILATTEGIQVVKLDRVQEFSFPALPEGLVTRPSLVWMLRASQAGSQDVRVTYLTNGVNWQANYIGMLSSDAKSLALTGWVTLDNTSGATYRDAKLKLVAGDVHRAPQPEPRAMAKGLATGGEGPLVEERAFFEYHLYEIARPVTVCNQQTKQIEFIAAPSVAVDKVFVYEPSPEYLPMYGDPLVDPRYGALSDAKVQVRVEFKNDAASGLGMALPKGVLFVYQDDIDGGAEMVGEDALDHTPQDEPVSLYLGEAFDIVGERTQTQFIKLGERGVEESYTIELRNHRPEAVVVRVVEHLFRAAEAKLVQSSAPYELLDAHTVHYKIEVPPDGVSRLEYTVRYTW